MSAIKNIEMRWVARTRTTREPRYWGGREAEDYDVVKHEFKVLQYRQYYEPSNVLARRGWGEWKDVPTVTEEP